MGRILEDSLPAEDRPAPRKKEQMDARKASIAFLVFALLLAISRHGPALAEYLQRKGVIP